jgi:hypothetical protein
MAFILIPSILSVPWTAYSETNGLTIEIKHLEGWIMARKDRSGCGRALISQS